MVVGPLIWILRLEGSSRGLAVRRKKGVDGSVEGCVEGRVGRNLGPLNRVFREIYEIWTDKVGNKSELPSKKEKRAEGRGEKKRRNQGAGVAESW